MVIDLLSWYITSILEGFDPNSRIFSSILEFLRIELSQKIH
jgi:hypothetical protein